MSSPQTSISHLQLVVSSNLKSRSPSRERSRISSDRSSISNNTLHTSRNAARRGKVCRGSRTGTWGLFSDSSCNQNDEEVDNDTDYEFYLGDIYSCISRPFDCILSTQAETEEVIGYYHQRVRDLSRGWQHLRYLADFMTVSTVPLRAKDLTSEARNERLNRVNISVIECDDKLSTLDLSSPQELEDFLSGLSDPEKAQKPRLLVVQDLSTVMIEKLGMAFDIEPGFFRSHIGDYVWLNTRDPQAEVPDMEAYSVSSNYFSLQYVSPRYFENETQLENGKSQTESFNVSRKIDHDGGFKPWSDKAGSDVGLVRSKISLWVRPKRVNEHVWLGILLVDPTVMDGFPLWSGYGNFHPPPSIHTRLEDVRFPGQGTDVQQFIFWTLNQACTKSFVPPPSPDLLPIAYFTMICAQWILMCEYINTRLGQIEWETELGLSNLYAKDFDHTLKTLLLWRKRVPIFHSFVDRSIKRIEVRYTCSESTAPFDSWDSILVNLKDILHRLDVLHQRADKIMTVSMAVTAREESKKATNESHAITRVSYLAFIFVPLSFLASFFSMGETFPMHTYWVYAIVAVPVSSFAIIILMFAGPIGRWWSKVRRYILGLKTKKRRGAPV